MNRTVCNTVCLYSELLIQTDQTNNTRCVPNEKMEKCVAAGAATETALVGPIIFLFIFICHMPFQFVLHYIRDFLDVHRYRCGNGILRDVNSTVFSTKWVSYIEYSDAESYKYRLRWNGEMQIKCFLR